MEEKMEFLKKAEWLMQNGFEIEVESNSMITLDGCIRIDDEDNCKERAFYVHLTVNMFKEKFEAQVDINADGKIYSSRLHRKISEALNEAIDLMNTDVQLFNRAFAKICSKRIELFPNGMEEA